MPWQRAIGLERLAGEERPSQRTALSALLGAIAIKDLLVNDVPRVLVAGPDELRLPFVRGLPTLPASGALGFALHVFAFACAIALVAGRFARVAGAALAAIYAWAFLADELQYTNNVFLFIVLLTLTSLEPLDPTKDAPAYPTLAMRALVSVIYLVGAIAKLRPAWLSGAILGEALHHYHWAYQGTLGFDAPIAFRALAILSTALEGFLAFALWIPRTRRRAIVLGVVFHLSIELLLPVRMFSFLMPAAYVLFVDASVLARFAAWRRDRPHALAAVGIATALGVDLVQAWLLKLQEVPPRYVLALLLACLAAFAAWGLLPRLRVRELTIVPRPLRAPLVLALAALELFAVSKPAFGFTNRFGWRMFTEVLRMKATVSALAPDGTWSPRAIDGRWSSEELRYHWDSLSEQREQLADYASWLRAREPSVSRVRVVMEYERDGVAGREVIER